MVYIKGIYKKCIFCNNDNNYIVGLIRIKETSINDDTLLDKTITFTGNFIDILLEDNLVLYGDIVEHFKYGKQFNTQRYEKILPEDNNSIVTFLSGGMFKGIGINKAKKIVDAFGENSLDVILNETEKLNSVKGLSKNNIDVLYNKMLEYEENIDILLKLNEFGFTSIDSVSLYKKYHQEILSIIDKNIYDLINDDDNLYFTKIDNLALKKGYKLDDLRRIKAAICYLIKELNYAIGDTYLYYNEIKNSLIKVLGINVDDNVFDDCLLALIENQKIVNEDKRYYLNAMYQSEHNIAKRLVYLNNKKDLNFKAIEENIDALQNDENIVYNKEQLDAIRMSLVKNLLIITGGPGTGKTTIIKAIVELYRKLYKNSDITNSLALLAPTGRASKRMMEAVHLPSQTIHRFLKWNKETNRFGINEYNKSTVEMVIIDEFSMVDTCLFDSLLKGLKYDTKIVLVGDYNQLPSVGTGQILKDLIESDMFNCIKLTELYRQHKNSNIISFAHNINDGNYLDESFNKEDDLTFINCDSYNIVDKISEICYSYKDYPYNKFQIMAPIYKTMNGIDNLNILVQNIFNPKDATKNEILIGDNIFREEDKVLQLVNMPDNNVYNGDIGIIKKIDNNKKEIYIDYDGNLVKYNKSSFKNFRLGYVISIHKSQGSEFKVVVMPMLKEYNRMLYRKLFYTGVTRAKTNLFILGEKEAIKKAIDTDFSLARKTSLVDFIKKMYEINNN